MADIVFHSFYVDFLSYSNYFVYCLFTPAVLLSIVSVMLPSLVHSPRYFSHIDNPTLRSSIITGLFSVVLTFLVLNFRCPNTVTCLHWPLPAWRHFLNILFNVLACPQVMNVFACPQVMHVFACPQVMNVLACL